jgi:hypothetical protein
MTPIDPYAPIIKELQALEQGEPRPWARIGLLLDQIEHTTYWRKQGADSFTVWLKTFSLLKLKEASLWRYLTAVRYYRALHQDLAHRGVFSPSPEDLPDQVSPENIELLSKLVRVVPEEVFLRLTTQVLGSNISRATLRQTWETYRPILAGRTARGTRTPPPMINRNDPGQQNLEREAHVITALFNNAPAWTGYAPPDLYELLTNVAPEPDGAPDQHLTFDVVATVRATPHSPLEIHGIEVHGQGLYLPDESLWPARQPYCNQLWLAISSQAIASEVPNLPDYVGLIVADEKGLRIARKGQADPQLGRRSGDLAKALLLKVLRR